MCTSLGLCAARLQDVKALLRRAFVETITEHRTSLPPTEVLAAVTKNNTLIGLRFFNKETDCVRTISATLLRLASVSVAFSYKGNEL